MGKMTVESLLTRVGLMLPIKHYFSSSSSTIITAVASNAKIGVLTFEVASLMSKTVRLHQSLTDDQIALLRNTIVNQGGVRKLVSDDENFLLGLALSEMLDLFSFLARSTARLGSKCSDPVLRRFGHVLSDLVVSGEDPFRLEYIGRKKVERKVRKMERFISASVGLYQEMEVLAELELGLKRLQQQQRGGDQGNGSLSAFKQKVVWQRQEVRNLKAASLWNRSYDYTVKLLARSLFSIFGRIKQVFSLQNDGNCHGVSVENGDDSRVLDWLELHRSHSSIISGPIKSIFRHTHHRAFSMSGPLRMSGSISEDFGMSKSGPIPRAVGRGRKRHQQRWPPVLQSVLRSGSKTKWATPGGPFKGCIAVGDDSQVLQSCVPSDSELRRSADKSRILRTDGCDSLDAQVEVVGSNWKKQLCLSLFEPQHNLLVSIHSTLGASALALHYANVIVVIEKLVASPHLIGPDARDDLYNMLPTSIRSELRARLKVYAKNLAESIYDPVLASEWSDAVARILEWLAPLAHNMIRWHSEHNYEQQHLFAKTNVLLLQTLFFANQAKTESAITELLVGLNYLWRFGRELHAKAMMESMSSESCDEHHDAKGSLSAPDCVGNCQIVRL